MVGLERDGSIEARQCLLGAFEVSENLAFVDPNRKARGLDCECLLIGVEALLLAARRPQSISQVHQNNWRVRRSFCGNVQKLQAFFQFTLGGLEHAQKMARVDVPRTVTEDLAIALLRLQKLAALVKS